MIMSQLLASANDKILCALDMHISNSCITPENEEKMIDFCPPG